jgi:integrase
MPTGDTRALGTYRTKADANAALAAFETDLARGNWLPGREEVRLADYAARWLDSRLLKPRTRESYADHLRLRILPTLGGYPVSRLTPAVVRGWYAQLHQQAQAAGRGQAVLSHSYRVLRAILTTAVEDELLPRNPCTIKGAGQDRPRERRLPTEPEIWALVDAAPARYRALVWLAAATALRSAELAGLRRCDIDLLHRLLHVRQTYVEPARGAAYFGPPKSDAGTRTLALPAVVVPLLEQHLAQWSGTGPDGLVFISEKGQPLSRHNRRWWREACLAAGLPPGTHLHDLRHAGLTLAAQSGATLKELMALAGHSSPRAAMIYQHAAEHRAAILAEAVSRRLERPVDGEQSA